MSWYRLYRPQTVSDLQLQVVREQFQALLKSGKIPHGLLFAGPKGTGKTSSARIIAKVLNCDKNKTVKPGKALHEPCLECDQCLAIAQGSAMNVFEMDAASNRRIDDIRALREQVYLPPVMGEKSVYIIDEVHMLTNEAFNALLKILEEPPEHAIFILATTELHRVPETILSRCMLVQFRKASVDELRSAVERVAEGEKITMEPAAITSIAEAADGSFRDVVKLFEQIVTATGKKTVSEADVLEKLQSVAQDDIQKFIQFILQREEHEVIRFFQKLRQMQADQLVIHRRLVEYLYEEYLKSIGYTDGEAFASAEVVLFLLKQFSSLTVDERMPVAFLPIEICALELIQKSKQKQQKPSSSGGSAPSVVEKTVEKVTVTETVVSVSEASEAVGTAESPEQLYQAIVTPQEENTVMNFSELGDGTLIQQRWAEFLRLVGTQNLSIEALLRSAQFVSGEPGRVSIKVFYKFHKEQLEVQRYKMIIEQSLSQLCGGKVVCEVELGATQVKQSDALQQHQNISGEVNSDELAHLAEQLLT